jgi:hypothetical protein
MQFENLQKLAVAVIRGAQTKLGTVLEKEGLATLDKLLKN